MNAPRSVVLFASVALACSAMAQETYNSSSYASPASSASSASSASYATQANAAVTDPPARVARLALVRGEVSFAPAGENDWVQAQMNRPVVTGDKLWTDNGGRAELQIGASTIRMDQKTSFDFLNLDDHTAQIELTQGSLDLEVRRIHGNESYEIDTPTLAFIADRVGNYRIDVDAQGNVTSVTARRGGGAIYGEGGAKVQISEGQALTFNNPQLRDYRTAPVQRRDDFENFVTERDRRYERPVAANYVSEDVVGYEDLDQYGSWSDAPEYGHVWYPRNVGADWAPYHDGRWAWVEPWGWTWVDDAPWGFAPFHYGRWVNVESRWGWVPGPVDVRPVYAPALVAFVGGGFGVDVAIGGSVGWFALGPRDVYFPGYRCGRGYFNSVNVSNARISNATVNNYYSGWSRGNVNYARINYANRSRPGALAAMPVGAFANGHAVATSDLTMNSRAALAKARVMPRAAVMPTRASVLAANGRAPRAGAHAAAFNRQVVAAHTPPPAPASFAARQRLLQRAPGEPLGRPQLRTLAAQQPRHGANVRTLLANQRGSVPNAPAAASRAKASSRNAVAQERVQHGNQRMQLASRNGAPMTMHANARQQLRSSDYAHAQQGRGAQRPAVRPQQPVSRQQFARAQPRSAEHRVAASPQRVPQIHQRVEQHGSPQERRTASRLQHAPQYQRPTMARGTSRQEQRKLTQQNAPAQRRRPSQRSLPQERRVAARPQHPSQVRQSRVQPAPQRAQARAEPPRVNAPASGQQRAARRQPQQYARQNTRPSMHARKDRKDGGRD